MKKLDINIGDIFGNWTVINTDRFSKNGHVYVQCQCSCGVIKDIASTALLRGKTSKCKKCSARNRTYKLNIGEVYKEFTIIEGPLYINSYSHYKVRCSCGKEYLKLTHELLDDNNNFRCASCAQKENKKQYMIDNGMIGELSLTRYTQLKNSAIKRGYCFNVSIEYLWNLFLKQEQLCAITGDKIHSFKEASLDRIDSTNGYIEGNVQWTTKQANLSKHIMSMSELYEFCSKVLNHANQQPSQT